MFTFRRTLQGLLLIAILIGIAVMIDSGLFSDLLGKEWIDGEIRDNGFNGGMLFVVIAALSASMGLPRQVVAFMAGYGFGFSLGVALAMLAIVSACVLSFGYGRLGSIMFSSVQLPQRMQQLARFIKDHTFTSTIMIRLLPLGGNLLVNLTAGAMRIPGVPFFAGSILGYIPQTLVFVLIGSGVQVDQGQRISLGVILFVISTLLGMKLYRSYQARLTAAAAVAPGH
jgi:uncharacterized membrane protein YdjX (TVP38/TMEM64 family)